MSQNREMPDLDSILNEAWDHVVGVMKWKMAVLFGEFVDNRPLSAVVVDMLISFVPGVVIVTSARDAVAIILRLTNHPEKREDLMEWVLLCACLITIALPIALAAGGAAVAGVGAIVGGIGGSQLGAALRAVMLMLINKAQRLTDLVQFLQKFISGDVLKFLHAIKFVQFEKSLLQAISKIVKKLVDIVAALRTHLESLHYVETVSASINKLAEWERKFYNVQQLAIEQIPRALVELDVRLAKVLADAAPKEAHTVSPGIAPTRDRVVVPLEQRVRDAPGKVIAKVAETGPVGGVRSQGAGLRSSSSLSTSATPQKPPLKDELEHNTRFEETANTKRQSAADAAAAADRTRITQLSEEAREATKRGDADLAKKKIDEARDILKPFLPRKNSNDSWDEVIKRLDVSSPKDLAVFWSGDAKAAQKFAERIGGVTLETTSGGRVIDNWDDLKGYAWSNLEGAPPYARDLWAGVSKKYAEAASGCVNVVQTSERLLSTKTLWNNVEKIALRDKLALGEITSIKIHELDINKELRSLGKEKIDQLLGFKGGI